MIYTFIFIGPIILGLSLMAIGAYLWLAAKKMIAGIILLAVGLIFTVVPIAFIAFFTITTSVHG